MTSPHWHARRIDTRELKHGNQDQIKMWLDECNGNEDHDEFRVRVRGLPRKSSKDSIIGQEAVAEALGRSKNFDINSVRFLPVVLTCDPAWTGGDETTIWYHQGPYSRMLEKYRLDRSKNEDHMVTYLKLVEWERELGADAVLIDQGEGTAIKTLANNQGKAWELISFAGSPNDTLDHKQSPYANIRAQMYYEANLWLQEGGILDARLPEWKDDIQKQLCWTNGSRHKVTGKKLCEAKVDVKARVGQSPDIADGFVLRFGRKVLERLEQNDHYQLSSNREVGGQPYMMPENTTSSDGILDADYKNIYGN
jgi:hypothetical protein